MIHSVLQSIRRTRLFRSDWFSRMYEIAYALGFLALLAGWSTIEAERQPWAILSLLRTRSAGSSVTEGDLALSLLSYFALYFLIYPLGFRHLLRLVRRRPGIS